MDSTVLTTNRKDRNMNTTRTRIADLQPGDIVSAHGGMFRITAQPFDSICHAPQDPASGWNVGPSDVAVAPAVCLEGEVPGYFKPGSDWVFQGATFVTVNRVAA